MNAFQGQVLAGAVIALAGVCLYLLFRTSMLNARLEELKGAVTKTLELLANDEGLLDVMREHNTAITSLSRLAKRTENWYADEGGLVRQVGKKEAE